MGARGQGLRHRRRHRHRQDARHPADRRGDPRRAAAGRRGQPRARGDAGDAALECRDRHHRHRAPLARRRPDHRGATRSSSTRSTRPPRNSSSASRSASAPAAGSSGSRPRSIPPIYRALSRQRRGARDERVRSGAQGEGHGARASSRPSFSTIARCGDSSARGAAWRSSCRRAPKSSGSAPNCGARFPRLATAFYHGGEPIRVLRPFLEGEVAEAVPARDDRGGPVGAQSPRARYGGDLRRALRQRGRARPQRAAPPLSRPERDPADGGPGAWPGCAAARSRSSPTATSISLRCVRGRPNSSSPATPNAWRSPAPRSASMPRDLDLPVPLDRAGIPARGRPAHRIAA